VLCVSPLLAQSPINDNSTVVKIRDVANSENIPNLELEKAYSVYRGAYLWGKRMDFAGADSFGETTDRMRLVVSKLEYVRNQELSNAAFAVLEKYDDDVIKFDDTNKAKYIDDLNYIAVGLKEAME
jgi:hypothetical protein